MPILNAFTEGSRVARIQPLGTASLSVAIRQKGTQLFANTDELGGCRLRLRDPQRQGHKNGQSDFSHWASLPRQAHPVLSR